MNPYKFTLLEPLSLHDFYDQLLLQDWLYEMIDDNQQMYKAQARINMLHDYAKEHPNPRFLIMFNKVKKEMLSDYNNNIKAVETSKTKKP